MQWMLTNVPNRALPLVYYGTELIVLTGSDDCLVQVTTWIDPNFA